MKSYLPTKKVKIKSLGEEIEIKALSAAAHIAISDTKGSGASVALLTCKHGVPAWKDESVEDLGANLPMEAVSDIATKIYELSGLDTAKNSESATDDDSS
jgi:hypothetical protein